MLLCDAIHSTVLLYVRITDISNTLTNIDEPIIYGPCLSNALLTVIPGSLHF